MADPAHSHPDLRDTGENGGREGSAALESLSMHLWFASAPLGAEISISFLFSFSFCPVLLPLPVVWFLSRATGKGSLVGADITEGKITNCVGQ